jgi:hypothetical protein
LNISSKATLSIGTDKLTPERVVPPHKCHFFNWKTLSLWQELENEEAHYHDPACKKDEEAKLQMAQH